MKDIKLARFKDGAVDLLRHYLQPGSSAAAQVIGAEEVAVLVASHVKVHRHRIYSPMDTLRLFVGQVLSADRACQDVVGRRLSERVRCNQTHNTLNTASYCQARARLPLAIPEQLGARIGARLEANAPCRWRWQGRSVKIFDATVVSMPDTQSNQQAFPQNSQERAGLGFPKARIGALIALASGAVLSYVINACKGKGSGEQSMLHQLLPWIEAGDVILADRLLASWWLIHDIEARGADLVMPQHARRATDFRRGQRLGRGDHVVQWSRPERPRTMSLEQYHSYPEKIVMREVKVNGRILVTTLCDEVCAPAAELGKLYSARWNIEVDFRTIKSTLEMDVLRCKTKEMIEKEIAVCLLAYNLVRCAMASAARLCELVPRALSFTGAKRVLSNFADQLRHGVAGTITIVLHSIAALRLPCRPDRIEPRAKKRRPINLPLLTVPRHVARANIARRKGLS